MNRILVISSGNTDLDLLLRDVCPDLTQIPFDAADFDPAAYDALCILGGDAEEAPVLSAPLRTRMEEMRSLGKPIFAEFLRSVGAAYVDKTIPTTHHRMVFDGTELPVDGLSRGDVLDGHRNDCIRYVFRNPAATPILTYHDYISAHDHVEMDEETRKKGLWALWKTDEHTLVASFRLSNFRRARLAPRRSFEALITAILRFLTGEAVTPVFPSPVCTHATVKDATENDVRAAVERGIAWFKNADMLKNGGTGGVREGFSHHVHAKDGVQERQNEIRTDCTGEVAGAFRLHAFYTENADSRRIADALSDFCFRYMQFKEGDHRGMIRWSETAWETCYQDDVARAIFPLLLCQYTEGSVPHFAEICEALDYMVDTTGKDGVRVSRTDCIQLTPAERERLRTSDGYASAHYNAYYHAALLLAYRAGGDRRYFDVALRGLSTLMARYPDTKRETSETEENCRLLFPLAVLFEITKREEHYAWLLRVAEFLDTHRHPSGAVPEWDTGYTAKCSRNHTGECALLAENGDPVVDLLYSNNWLPLGYAYAYLATGEERFATAWRITASFLLSCQIQSDDPLLDGAWARAFDLLHGEIHGVPHDVGWAPACVETGWTVGEILIGLQFMQTAESIRKKTLLP